MIVKVVAVTETRRYDTVPLLKHQVSDASESESLAYLDLYLYPNNDNNVFTCFTQSSKTTTST